MQVGTPVSRAATSAPPLQSQIISRGEDRGLIAAPPSSPAPHFPSVHSAAELYNFDFDLYSIIHIQYICQEFAHCVAGFCCLDIG